MNKVNFTFSLLSKYFSSLLLVMMLAVGWQNAAAQDCDVTDFTIARTCDGLFQITWEGAEDAEGTFNVEYGTNTGSGTLTGIMNGTTFADADGILDCDLPGADGAGQRINASFEYTCDETLTNDFVGASVVNCSAVMPCPTIAIEDPCECQDDQSENGAKDGTFSETVTITGATGLTLTVGTGSTGMQDAAGDEITVGTAIPEDPAGSGTYVLEFFHVDAAGYTLNVADGAGAAVLDVDGEQLSATNTCYYPEFDEPDGGILVEVVLCETTENIDVATLLGDELRGMEGTFDPATINPLVDGVVGEPTPVFIDFEATSEDGTDPGEDPGCTVELEIMLLVMETNNTNSCNDLVNLSLKIGRAHV